MPEVRRARKISPLTHSGVSIASGAIDDAMRPRQFSVVRLAIRAQKTSRLRMITFTKGKIESLECCCAIVQRILCLRSTLLNP